MDRLRATITHLAATPVTLEAYRAADWLGVDASALRDTGLSREDSARVYDLLQARVTAPENTVRWRWQAGDVVIWDNRATQHVAVNDYGDAHRVVRRVTLAGDVPVGPDGRASTPRTTN